MPEESLQVFSTNPLSPSLQFYLMPSFNFSRSVVFGFSLVAALIAVALVILPSPWSVSDLVSGKQSSSSSIPNVQSHATNLANPDSKKMASRAAPLVFPALSRHTATVIFVHGLGDSGHGWADAVQLWQRKHRLDEVKFILPNARVMPITVNGGFPMPAWFDVKSLGASSNMTLDERSRDTDEAGILESRAYLYSLIQSEVSQGISSDRVVLGGFSQGGAMSLFSGITAPFKLAGIVGMSCWLPLSHKLKELIPGTNFNQDTPIFMGHGDVDPTVLYEWGTATEQRLKDLNYDVNLETYGGMGHSACMEEFDDVESFLVSKLPAKGSA
ncbi:acyl-protein thioesterase 1 [Trichoderma asperellum]|uniref:Acyl-protein thioesterase 1 n=1 Tax=Trichoderma asperellum TaxID=101201 RepID=A0A6V8R4N6_TRIAP|nr:acyl-protein thioesterase 1 [Trichoderma asperellum]